MRVIDRPFSDLLRQPNDVVAELADHDVVLRRRNAPSLRLSAVERDDERAEAFVALSRLLRTMMMRSPAGFDQTVADVFPWATFLPPPDRRLFVDELTTTLMAVAEMDNYAPVGQLLREWKATAEIHADPRLARRLSRSIDGSGDAVSIPG